jgi:hypothetical protein
MDGPVVGRICNARCVDDSCQPTPPRPRRSVRWLGAVLGHFVWAKIVGWLATTRGRGAQLLIIQLIPLPSTIGEYLPFLRTD